VNQGQRFDPPQLRRLGDYELIEELARGGVGVIYRARQLSLNRVVALKMIRDSHLASPRSIQRFQIEAEAAAKLEHPNIVPIYEFGELEGQQFLSMKLVEGQDLAKRLHGVPMDARPLAQLMATLARAIHYAHQRGILHRDLKPANVLIDAHGQPHVTDFGLAKLPDHEANLTLSRDILGSPNYMAPEQAAGKTHELTTAADVYSLGAILYELLTGRAPFLADTPLETLRQVTQDEPRPPSALYRFADRDLQTICLKCMEKDPARRYGSAEKLAEDLERWLDGRPIQARRVTLAERVWKWARRRPALAGLGGTAALLILLIAIGVPSFRRARAQAAEARARAKAELVEAEQEFRNSLARLGDKRTFQASSVLTLLARDLWLQSRYEEAEGFARQSLKIREEVCPNSWYRFVTQCLVGACLLGQRNFGEAEPLMQSGFEGMMQRAYQIAPAELPGVKEDLNALASLFVDLGQPQKAAEWRQRAEMLAKAASEKPRPGFMSGTN
jgi:tRNA A-37 threonylcarbamoyl transferase component Bud32